MNVGRTRRTRADAVRSRDRILTAAREVFAEEGVAASLEKIAQRAGAGSATLHRHFAGRAALAEAVLHDRVEALCTQARCLSADPDPGAALRTWLRAVVEHSNSFRGLAVLLSGKETAHHDRIRSAGSELLLKAQGSGEARDDVTISELLQLANGIAVATERSKDRATDADRLLNLMITGVRPRSR
ncbi:TetR/AcrR family transcriptional regulator [Streptosporangium sp. NBC_01756]|uniref:TetR/AcrR family transcriptional regulator n=1 Tax=Streptosporangium sp. NBC_01756 TaxID=2975950 RepID=UPI002DD7E419|nr:helix-turn-helix domain-containing protein [Streptosporangium sp. NBC_01756]WSC86500.1 TetR/AcrR family transcriptional regulator [Streptosporangium sp. NBC_01756]